MQDEVLEFINRRWKQDSHFLDGNCYYFSIILKDRFPSGRIWYDLIWRHFFFEYNGKYYDFSGELDSSREVHSILWDEMGAYDRLDKERVVRDCIM